MGRHDLQPLRSRPAQQRSGVGGNPALVGTILGYKVKVNQPDFYMIGKDDFGGNVNIALVE